MENSTNSIKAILVDDEASARDVLENLLLRFCPEVQLIGKYKHLEQAVEAIKADKPDLVFLDIEMPNYAGYEIVHFFDKIDFDIIFVSAYDKYAIRAFEVSAVDYLLKPIDIDRLKIAVKRAVANRDIKSQVERFNIMIDTLQSKQIKNLIISEKSQQFVIHIDSIIAIEAQESYCFIHTIDNKHMVSKNLKHFETILEQNENFFRVHRSWLLNTNFVENFSKSMLEVKMKKELVAKLSKVKKHEFEQFLLKKSN